MARKRKLDAGDVSKVPKREFRSIIPKLWAGEVETSVPKAKPQVAQMSKGKVKPANGGLSVSVQTPDDLDQKWSAGEIAKLLSS